MGDFPALLIFFATPLLFFRDRMFQKVDWPNPLSSSSPSHPFFYPPSSSSHFRVKHTRSCTQSGVLSGGKAISPELFSFSFLLSFAFSFLLSTKKCSTSPTHLFHLAPSFFLSLSASFSLYRSFSRRATQSWRVRQKRMHTKKALLFVCRCAVVVTRAPPHPHPPPASLSSAHGVHFFLFDSLSFLTLGNKKRHLWLRVGSCEERNEKVPVGRFFVDRLLLVLICEGRLLSANDGYQLYVCLAVSY